MAIEEDFKTARKIARASVSTREALETALGPLLPLKRVARLEDVDIRARLRKNDDAQKDFKKAIELDAGLKDSIEPLILQLKGK